MSWAICKACGKEIHWRARRGVRLANLRCHCGGELQGKTAGRPGATRGRKLRLCGFCEKCRTQIETAEAWELSSWPPTGAESAPKVGAVGVPICRRCRSRILSVGSRTEQSPWGRPVACRLIGQVDALLEVE